MKKGRGYQVRKCLAHYFNQEYNRNKKDVQVNKKNVQINKKDVQVNKKSTRSYLQKTNNILIDH